MEKLRQNQSSYSCRNHRYCKMLFLFLGGFKMIFEDYEEEDINVLDIEGMKELNDEINLSVYEDIANNESEWN